MDRDAVPLSGEEPVVFKSHCGVPLAINPWNGTFVAEVAGGVIRARTFHGVHVAVEKAIARAPLRVAAMIRAPDGFHPVTIVGVSSNGRFRLEGGRVVDPRAMAIYRWDQAAAVAYADLRRCYQEHHAALSAIEEEQARL